MKGGNSLAYWIIGVLAIVNMIKANIDAGKPDKKLDEKRTLKKEWYCVFMSSVLFLILALQSTVSNTDLETYQIAFSRACDRDVAYYFTHFNTVRDPFYHIIGMAFAKIGFGFFMWKTLICLVFILSMTRLIVRYSKNPALSYLVMISLGLYNFSFSALRQTLALAVISFSYEMLKNKKPIKFALIIVLAALFHRTVLIFLLAYPIYHLRIKLRSILILIAAGGLVIWQAERLARLYLRFAGLEEVYSEYFERETVLSIWGIVIFASVWLFCALCLYQNKKRAFDAKICNLLLVAVVFRLLSVVLVAEFFRLSMYFALFNFLAIPDACRCDKSKNTDRVKVIVITLIFVAYYFVSPQKNIVTYIPI